MLFFHFSFVFPSSHQCFIEFAGMAEQEAQRRIQAERAAASAMESAALKRRKAQELMQKADLAMYKAVMALRYADAAQAGKSVDFLDSELNGDDKE